MRGEWRRTVWLGLGLLATCGCWDSGPQLRPPPPPEEYSLPPAEDSRFSTPVEYPRGILNQDLIRKPPSTPGGPNGPGSLPQHIGMGSGAGGASGY
jgi:hypothetical protein